MSRRLVALLIILLGVVTPLAAQDDIPEFNKLRTPTSPAFVVLGTTPADVQRPNTPSTFAFSLLQGISNSAAGGGDFAVEVAPYWLVSHPGLTLSEYYRGGWAANVARTATLSFATLGVDDAGVASGRSRDFGIGVRARILNGTVASTACDSAMDTMRVVLRAGATFLATSISRKYPEGATSADSAAIDEQNETLYHQFVRNLSKPEREAITGEVQECANELSARTGVQMDIAGAAAWRLPNQEPDDTSLRSGAVWVTPSWTGKNFSWVGVGRYRWNQNSDAENLVDVGLRGIYAWDDYGLSLEAVTRKPTDGGDDRYRVSLITDVLVSKGLWLTMSFGRDFTREDSDAVFALANLQWNIGKRSITPDLR